MNIFRILSPDPGGAQDLTPFVVIKIGDQERHRGWNDKSRWNHREKNDVEQYGEVVQEKALQYGDFLK